MEVWCNAVRRKSLPPVIRTVIITENKKISTFEAGMLLKTIGGIWKVRIN
jgi:hypothetical protein